ncbi:myosin-9-like [Stegodyphus dumicola]|uniref:myosin-9-like n=1 Tax=Stegodyphus dumicola TaxID=202533 RepID=UPI0015A98AA2|nr:myosin-9-like [Stegodyphus dumicola]
MGQYDLSIIEKLKKELEIAAENSGKFQTENSQLRSQIKSLENEVKTLKDMLEKAEKEIESERVQVETLCEEIANISQNSMKGDSLLPISDATKLKLEALEKVKALLTKKLEFYENQLKEKNIEIQNLEVSVTQLKSTLQAKEKDLEIEQVQVDTLLQELGSLVSYQKRLEQDFNIVQDMMHQKERELETLHEETEAQMKLEAEVESLEKLLEDQKNIELDLKQRVNELEKVVENAKYSTEQLKAQWKSNVEELEKAHQIDIEKMKNQIDVLKQNIIFNQNTEDIDIASVKKEIVASALAFRLDQNEDKLQFENIVYATLKRTIDTNLKKLEKKHETDINDINENWQQKIKVELESKEKDMRSHYEKYKKDKIQLQKKFEKEKMRISSEKDAYWQEKLKELGKSLSDEKGKNEKISKLLEYIEGNFQETHRTQVNSLKGELDQILKEKVEAEEQVRNLSKNIEELKQEISALQKSFKSKIHSMEEKFESEKMQLESFYKLETEKLQCTLHSALEREKTIESKHKEELFALHKFFETRWKNEMKKIQSSQIEELKKLKDSKDKNVEALCSNYFKVYEEKLNKMQERCEFQIAEERKHIFQQHREELVQLRHALEERFEKEKVTLIDMKEKELKAAFDSLNKALNVKAVDSATKEDKDWEKEKSNLISQHQNEMALLKRELQQKYEKKLQNQLMAHNVEMKHIEESYNQQVEELHELIKEAKRVASRTCNSDSGSNRTTTPSSEMTSSDEACSSCQEDMLSRNKHVLVNKIHQDGKRVLSLIESSQKPVSSEIEVKHWLDERKWVVNKVKTVVIIDDPEDVKLAVSKLVEEIQARKRKFEIASKENQELREKCFELELKLREENSKLHDITANLNKQNSINSDLQYLLRLRTTEVTDLRKALEDQVKFSLSPSLKNTYSHQSENLTSSYEIGCLRSADEPRSHEQFSMLLPEISSIPSKDPGLKVHVACDEYEETAFANLTRKSESEISDVKQELLDKQASTFEQIYEQTKMSAFNQKDSDLISSAKLHSLYCIYRRIRSHNKALIYQKKYLLKLLAYFETTENFTLAWLNNLAINSPVDQSSNSLKSATIIINGKFRFRSMAFAVVAVHRMKFAVRCHRLLSRVPAARVVNVEIQSIFQKYPHFSPTVTPDGCHLSTVSLSSKSASISESYEQCRNSATSIESRADNKKSKSSVYDKSQLVQYVHRLEELQKQLGLDTFS